MDKSKHVVHSLQYHCCNTISLHCEKYPPAVLDDLSQPCLHLLVDHLSMFSVLSLESYLQGRGVDVRAVMYSLHQKLFKHVETYPIKSTTCPHLLEPFRHDGLDWGISRLLYRRVIALMVQEYNNGDGRKGINFEGEITENVARQTDALLELFTPPQLLGAGKVNVTQLDKMVERLAVMAGSKIIYMAVDFRIYNFLLDKKYEEISHSCLSALAVVSVVLRKSVGLLEFVCKLKELAKNLNRVCIYGIKGNDLQFLDSILSMWSGVQCFYTTPEGRKDWQVLCDVAAQEEFSSLSKYLQHPEVTDEREEDVVGERASTAANSGFDLMDDAVLFGTQCPPCQFDSNEGISKMDMKFTNLVETQVYSDVLNHHLRSWLALQELHLGVHEFDPKTVECVCQVLQRPQFKGFTISSAFVTFSNMEDFLCAVASRRGSKPLEKLIFVSVQERRETFDDLFVMENLIGKSQSDIDEFVKGNESQKFAKFSGFEGTKLLEFTSCSFGPRTECVINQYVTQDTALDTLCIHFNLSRVTVQTILQSLARANRRLSRLLLETWHVLQESSCVALANFLSSTSECLHSLSLKSCLTVRNMTKYNDIVEAIATCKNLRYLDLSMNNLGDESVEMMKKILPGTSITELSLKKDNFTKPTALRLLQTMADIFKHRRRPLDILDMRGTVFLEADREQHRDLVEDVARCFLVDPTLVTM